MRLPALAPLLSLILTAPATAQPERLADPMRPICALTDSSFTLQYYTTEPTETRVQVREANHSLGALRGLMDAPTNPWDTPAATEITGPPGKRTYHRITIDELAPGRRYFYRIWDPAASPTGAEQDWGAAGGWQREYAIATLAAPGHRTIVRHPVKVLLMPNVINVESAAVAAADGESVPHPQPMSAERLELMKREIEAASRFFFINSGLRFWVDFEVVVDDRWQRWGPEATAQSHPDFDSAFYQGWPVCRSYAGVDYRSPGGGEFTFFDPADPASVLGANPTGADPFPSQIEIAFPRRWRPELGQWWYYTSGGGTLGVDSVPNGIPGRSQFLGGYDTCWLVTHEFHHQMESLGAISLAFREDERIVFNHWAPRSRNRAPDAASGPEGEQRPHPWTTSARHGEHYDGMAYWDRTLTDIQWLRMMLGEVITVADADGDGVPDADPRLPIDEARFGSDPSKVSTDGHITDFEKIMLSTWAPAPLQVSWLKPDQTFARPDPRNPDSDGDGVIDAEDAAPLIPHPPFIWPGPAAADGDPAEWTDVPLTGDIDAPDLRATYQHQHDERAYTALITLTGDWRRARIVLDGEGKGVYSGEGVQAFEIRPGAGGAAPELRPTFVGVRGLSWKSSLADDGTALVEIEIRNWADPHEQDNRGWFWQGAGREVGVTMEVTNPAGGIYSMFEPYRPFYCLMLEPAGQPAMPGSPPPLLTRDEADLVITPDSPPTALDRLDIGRGWSVADGAWRHAGAGESALIIGGLEAGDFDLLAIVEARQDAILGAYVRGQERIGAAHDYCMFVGGYSNTRTRLRLFGKETGDSGQMVSPGRHTMQLSRRGGVIWGLWDGECILWSYDPRPQQVVDRLAVLGGYGGAQVVHEIRLRTR
ncbi:MAG: fibronectin type III domain-containing protein [Phycisphaerales bacterium JB039]